ncbi:family 78 glycoside hydrolase catalytic domain [Microbacterium sp. C7(2022)]|uniref:family 78 glycoside hydrolase catalytic domain n=1 Tax=Microbacterium sp. C7(2022) TaxID=2992759 RepID=UPI00237A1500|nr:family 78 glycoside hydrolase catalytic domain [Microbacterium sp. C7(2022)]MDE0546692.1 glycoside hydrolase family 78 protein [Microbacterium sp. C7(2022)]
MSHTTPYALSVDSGGDGFVVTGDRPRLSYISSGGRHVIEAIIDGGTPVTAEVDGHRIIEWPFAPLVSGNTVQWRVRQAVPDAAWSASAAFEAGLLDGDWTAKWISPAEGDDAGYGLRPAHVLTGTFTLPAEAVSARLYATALGVYTASVNGRRVGDDELAPGTTSYDRTLYAQAHDVTSLLSIGANRIEIELSDGWYRGQVGAFRLPAGWGTTIGVRAEVHVRLADGSTTVVSTDGDWTSAASTTTRADLMAGQSVDFSAPPAPPTPVRVGVVTDPPAISWSPAPPVRVIESRSPVAVTEISDGVTVVDFGQNASGWIRVTDLGEPGTRTVIDYGEYVDASGDLSTSHLDSVRPEGRKEFVQRDEVIAGPAGDVFEPRHTVHGFQYARIARTGTPLDAASLTMQVVHTDLERTGSFHSSDADLNRLHEVADWSFRGNAVDVPTDCPTRERLAWTGDYQVFAPTATRLYDVLGFTRKWLRSVRDDQLDDGRIANFSPDGRRIKHNLDDQFAMMTGSSGWGDAIVAVPWEMYLSYGDRLVLEENYDAMVRWVEWALEKARTERHHARVQASPEPEPFEQYLWDGTFHWGEWTEPKQRDADGNRIDPIAHNPMAWFMADKGEVGTAYLHRSTATLARIAEVLGKESDAATYAATATRISGAWREAYLHEDGTTVTDSQAAYVRALSFGLIPEALRPAATARLIELIEEAGMHLGTGFLATGDLLPVLADAGRADVAYALLAQRSAPSWLYMLDRGATTIWEDWEGIDEQGVAHDSLNHYSKGAVIRFLHTHTLGLRQDADSIAWEKVVIAPVPAPGMTWARGTHAGPQGEIAVEWRIDGDSIRITADIPAGTTARVIFPDGTEHQALPGRFDRSAGLPASDPTVIAR